MINISKNINITIQTFVNLSKILSYMIILISNNNNEISKDLLIEAFCYLNIIGINSNFDIFISNINFIYDLYKNDEILLNTKINKYIYFMNYNIFIIINENYIINNKIKYYNTIKTIYNNYISNLLRHIRKCVTYLRTKMIINETTQYEYDESTELMKYSLILNKSMESIHNFYLLLQFNDLENINLNNNTNNSLNNSNIKSLLLEIIEIIYKQNFITLIQLIHSILDRILPNLVTLKKFMSTIRQLIDTNNKPKRSLRPSHTITVATSTSTSNITMNNNNKINGLKISFTIIDGIIRYSVFQLLEIIAKTNPSKLSLNLFRLHLFEDFCGSISFLSIIHLFIYLFIHLFIYSFIYSFIHSFIDLLSRLILLRLFESHFVGF